MATGHEKLHSDTHESSGDDELDPTNFGGSCSSMYQRDNSNATTISVTSTWYQVANFIAGVLRQWTFASNTLTAGAEAGGDYLLLYSVCFKGNKDDSYEFALAINDVIQNETVQCKFSDQPNLALHISGNACLPITAGQTVKLMVRNITNVGDATIVDSNVTVNRVL